MMYKFRAWSEHNKEMYTQDFDDIVMPENQSLFLTGLDAEGELYAGHYLEDGEWEDLILMMWTALKDKNGKEIYEGDEMLHPDFSGIRKLIVTIESGCAWLAGWDCVRTDLTKGEVIGNIHENKDLLK